MVVGDEVITTPTNAAYMRFSVVDTTTYNCDICINRSADSVFSG